MTTRIEITCKGPDRLAIWFCDCNGKPTNDKTVVLEVGQIHTFDTWDGKRAMPFAVGHGVEVPDGIAKFYAVPPATMY